MLAIHKLYIVVYSYFEHITVPIVEMMWDYMFPSGAWKHKDLIYMEMTCTYIRGT